jgi:hypothetical protein
VVQNSVSHEWIPQATACVQFFQSLGGAIFIAVAQAVFQNGLAEGVERDAPGIPPQIFINSGASQIPQVLEKLHAEQYLTEVLTAYLDGLRNSYFITVACAAAAFVAAWGLFCIMNPTHMGVVPGLGGRSTGEFGVDANGEAEGNANGVAQEKA